jgi:hypothetical protein
MTILVGVALLIASAAHADRTFDLDGTLTFRALGQSLTENVSGILTLFDDGTYTLDAGGELSSGIWLQEGKKIQLFREEPTISEVVAELEAEASAAAGMAISLTSVVGRERIQSTRTGDITVSRATTYILRPGPRPGQPLRIKILEKLVGALR